jgi:hypothetical protein
VKPNGTTIPFEQPALKTDPVSRAPGSGAGTRERSVSAGAAAFGGAG